MQSDERRGDLLTRLEKEGRVSVSALSKIYGVSEETVRRDLEKLEAKGFARRCYGGAVFTGGRELPYNVRKKTNVSAKLRIASAAATLIHDGESVMLDDSSTAIFVAQALREKKGLTGITNSVEILLQIADRPDRTVLIAGGLLKPQTLSLSGAKAELFLSDYHVDWSIISCAGIDEQRGVSDVSEEGARIKRAMLGAGEKKVLVADRRKFSRRAFASVAPITELDAVVTDLEEDDPRCAFLRQAGIECICS